MDQHRQGWQRQQEMQRIHDNPDSEENQRKIAEAIQQEQLQANLEFAMRSEEHTSELQSLMRISYAVFCLKKKKKKLKIIKTHTHKTMSNTQHRTKTNKQ